MLTNLRSHGAVVRLSRLAFAALLLIPAVSFQSAGASSSSAQKESCGAARSARTPVRSGRAYLAGASGSESIPSGESSATAAASNGEAGSRLLRIARADYEDSMGKPAGANRPSAREISNRVSYQGRQRLSRNRASDMMWLWGQFVDHDIDLTIADEPLDAFDIKVPKGDRFFDPDGTGKQVIQLYRSAYDHGSGHSPNDPRAQINSITAFLDASNVYGSDPDREKALRERDGSGELLTSQGNLLPFNERGLDNAGGPSSKLYVAGDIRANENVALTSMHTLWMREHNRLARQIHGASPKLSDDQVFARARGFVVGMMQAITYNEFLPRLLGKNAIPAYSGWKSGVDPGVCQEFSTGAYRFGHSMVSPGLQRLDSSLKPTGGGPLPLARAFFAPHELTPAIGIEPYLRGVAVQRAWRIDTMIVDALRNFLFGPPGSGGFDLASLNIQRGRDHGLADYNSVRAAYGLAHLTKFSQLGGEKRIQKRLERLHHNIDDVDLWTVGLSESNVRGAMVGPTFLTIMADQFRRIRDGDPNFYKRRFSGNLLRKIDRTRLSDVIRRNTTIGGEIAKDVFRAPK